MGGMDDDNTLEVALTNTQKRNENRNESVVSPRFGWDGGYKGPDATAKKTKARAGCRERVVVVTFRHRDGERGTEIRVGGGIGEVGEELEYIRLMRRE